MKIIVCALIMLYLRNLMTKFFLSAWNQILKNLAEKIEHFELRYVIIKIIFRFVICVFCLDCPNMCNVKKYILYSHFVWCILYQPF